MKTKSVLNIALSLVAVGISIPLQAQANISFNDPTYGREYGLEHQLETVDGEDFVERIYGRLILTTEWDLDKNKRGDVWNAKIKGGALVGRYKGSLVEDDDYGSLVKTQGGITAEAETTYTFNAGKVDPVVGVSGVFDFTGGYRRTEWQADAIAGVKIDINHSDDMTVLYKKTLAHGFNYVDEDDVKYRQDDGYAVSLIGTRHLLNGRKRSIAVTYENFEASPYVYKTRPDGGINRSYEPDTANTMISYSHTF